MAVMVTALHGSEIQSKEFLYHFLWTKLSDQFYIWHDVILPKGNQRIDFVILHPNYGLWVIELEIWEIEQVLSGNLKECQLFVDGKESAVRNPLRRAYEKSILLKMLLENEPTLLSENTGSNKENLLFAVHHLAVLININDSDINLRQLEETFPEQHIITSDIVRNPMVNESTVENALMHRREPVFINAYGLNRAQLAAIRKVLQPATPSAEETPPVVETPEIPDEAETALPAVETPEVSNVAEAAPPTPEITHTAETSAETPAPDAAEAPDDAANLYKMGDPLPREPDVDMEDVYGMQAGASEAPNIAPAETPPVAEERDDNEAIEEIGEVFEAEPEPEDFIVPPLPDKQERQIIQYSAGETDPFLYREMTEEEVAAAEEEQAPETEPVAETVESPPELQNTVSTRLPASFDDPPEENPGVEINKIIAYIVKQNDIILQRMWKKS